MYGFEGGCRRPSIRKGSVNLNLNGVKTRAEAPKTCRGPEANKMLNGKIGENHRSSSRESRFTDPHQNLRLTTSAASPDFKAN